MQFLCHALSFTSVGIALDLIGFVLLSRVLVWDQKRLALFKLRSELAIATRPIYTQYVGPEELSGELATGHLERLNENDFKNEDEVIQQIVRNLEHVTFPKIVPSLREAAKQFLNPDSTPDALALKSQYIDFLRAYPELDRVRAKYEKPNSGIRLAIFLVIAGFALQLIGSVFVSL